MGGNLDCGHAPLLSVYYAALWKIFGKSLLVSHLGQWPFLFIILVQISNLIKNANNKNIYLAVLIIILTQTTVLAQASQVAYELPMIALFMLVATNFLNLYIYNKPINKAIILLCIIILPFLQMRAIAALIALCLFEFYLFYNSNILKNRNHFLKIIFKYSFSAILFLIWLSIHKYYTGYYITDPQSIWGPNNNGVVSSFSQFIKNFVFCVWLLIDNGFIYYWIIVALLIFKFYNKISYPTKAILILLIIISACNTALFSIMSKAIAHRYFFSSYILLLIIFGIMILNYLQNNFYRYIFFSFAIALNIFWCYYVWPDRIPKSWDSTIAYMPYFQIKETAFDYINKNLSNQKDSIYGVFPLTESISCTKLKPENKSDIIIKDITETNFDSCQYILYSNICTAYTDAQLMKLNTNYTKIYTLYKGALHIDLYKNKFNFATYKK